MYRQQTSNENYVITKVAHTDSTISSTKLAIIFQASKYLARLAPKPKHNLLSLVNIFPPTSMKLLLYHSYHWPYLISRRALVEIINQSTDGQTSFFWTALWSNLPAMQPSPNNIIIFISKEINTDGMGSTQ